MSDYSTPTGRDWPHRILFVCTANICRSAAAEALARHRFGEQTMMFRSAGFLGPGQECPLPLVEVLGEQGIDVSRHRSYQLDEPSLRSADLILTMEGDHVQRATVLHRAAFARIVPLTEAAETMLRLPARNVGVGDLVAEVNQNRDPRSYLSTRWDVADPYGRRLKDYKKAVQQITELIDTVIGRLSTAPPT